MQGPLDLEPCPGCGAMVPRILGPTHAYIGASPGCWAIHGELSARNWAGGEVAAHQLFVDAYAAQHPGTPSPQSIQSVAVHLLALYAVFEKGHAPENATTIRNRALRRKGVFRWLEPPSFAKALTILHVHSEGGQALYARQVDEWARSVWQAWQPHHATIAAWFAQYVEG